MTLDAEVLAQEVRLCLMEMRRTGRVLGWVWIGPPATDRAFSLNVWDVVPPSREAE